MENIKCILIGDAAIHSYLTNTFSREYSPTVFENFAANILVGAKEYGLGLFDTAGHEDYDRMRPLCYPLTDVFLICFSLADGLSLRHVSSKWVPEVRRQCPKTPIIRVGTKLDLRDEANMTNKSSLVSWKEGSDMAHEVRALFYLGCSAATKPASLKICIDKAVRTIVYQGTDSEVQV